MKNFKSASVALDDPRLQILGTVAVFAVVTVLWAWITYSHPHAWGVYGDELADASIAERALKNEVNMPLMAFPPYNGSQKAMLLLLFFQVFGFSLVTIKSFSGIATLFSSVIFSFGLSRIQIWRSRLPSLATFVLVLFHPVFLYFSRNDYGPLSVNTPVRAALVVLFLFVISQNSDRSNRPSTSAFFILGFLGGFSIWHHFVNAALVLPMLILLIWSRSFDLRRLTVTVTAGFFGLAPALWSWATNFEVYLQMSRGRLAQQYSFTQDSILKLTNFKSYFSPAIGCSESGFLDHPLMCQTGWDVSIYALVVICIAILALRSGQRVQKYSLALSCGVFLGWFFFPNAFGIHHISVVALPVLATALLTIFPSRTKPDRVRIALLTVTFLITGWSTLKFLTAVRNQNIAAPPKNIYFNAGIYELAHRFEAPLRQDPAIHVYSSFWLGGTTLRILMPPELQSQITDGPWLELQPTTKDVETVLGSPAGSFIVLIDNNLPNSLLETVNAAGFERSTSLSAAPWLVYQKR